MEALVNVQGDPTDSDLCLDYRKRTVIPISVS